MAAGQLAIKHGFMGPNNSVSTACATGLYSLGDAMQLLNSGMADVVIAGATESAICALSIAGFCQAKALNTKSNEDPAKASRPFDRTRTGFVLGEGAAIFVLERLDSIPCRYYCRLTGFGASADAHHITASRPDGLGAVLAMQRAMKNIEGSVDYINAHATSTPIGDEAEAMAIKRLFHDHAPCVSSSKGHLGHLLGAAGAVEAAVCALALKHQTIPHTANLTNPLRDDIDFVVREPRQRVLKNALCNSFGFGGTNASLLLSS
jgi:3-oxoacyl-[acyl-carrier-protein] synthase II